MSDLTVGSDAVRRLADAQPRRLLPEWAYLTPGAFWWAFDPGSAPTRGHAGDCNDWIIDRGRPSSSA